jgi:hypothetical protein
MDVLFFPEILSLKGISWDNMGVNGIIWESLCTELSTGDAGSTYGKSLEGLLVGVLKVCLDGEQREYVSLTLRAHDEIYVAVVGGSPFNRSFAT